MIFPERFLDALSSKQHLDIRRALRELARNTEALVVVLDHSARRVDYHGDATALPSDWLRIDATVPSYIDIRSRDGDTRTSMAVKLRVPGSGMVLSLAAVAPRVACTPELMDAMDGAAERLEESLV